MQIQIHTDEGGRDISAADFTGITFPAALTALSSAAGFDPVPCADAEALASAVREKYRGHEHDDVEVTVTQ